MGVRATVEVAAFDLAGRGQAALWSGAMTIDGIKRNGVILLDGGIGQELRRRCQTGYDRLWGSLILLEQPEVVRELHEDYLRAGAGVITTNTYPVVKRRLAESTDLAERWEELTRIACDLALGAREAVGEPALIAGCLPPLHGSYRVDLIPPFEEMAATYAEHVKVLEPHVDVFLCETMTNAEEGFAAASAAAEGGKPVWVSWNLKDDDSASLRSGESLAQAWAALEGLSVEAAMVNCCSPESITAAIPKLQALGAPLVGGHANAFAHIPENWSVKAGGTKALGVRKDLDPDTYAAHVNDWLDAGASIVGGCCEVGPAHIERIAGLLGERVPV